MSGSLDRIVYCLAPEYLEMRIQGIIKLIMQQQNSLKCTSEQISVKPQALHRISVFMALQHMILKHISPERCQLYIFKFFLKQSCEIIVLIEECKNMHHNNKNLFSMFIY